MKGKNSNDIPTPSVSEPEAVYARLTPDHQAIAGMQSGEHRKGRMTVDEFCNMLHRYVDEYYDGIPG